MILHQKLHCDSFLHYSLIKVVLRPYKVKNSILILLIFLSVSSVGLIDASQNNANGTYKIDQTLDSVPVRQPRQDKPIATNLFPPITSPMGVPNPQNANSSAFFAVPKPQNLDVTNKRNTCTLSKGPVSQPGQTINQNASRKPFMSSSKPTDILLRNLHSTPIATDDTECSMENSLSISKIADYLGKDYSVIIKFFFLILLKFFSF